MFVQSEWTHSDLASSSVSSVTRFQLGMILVAREANGLPSSAERLQFGNLEEGTEIQDIAQFH